MGRRGPKPIPTTLKILSGRPGHHPLPKREPKPKLCIPPCPSWLNSDAKKIYKNLGKILLENKVISVADGVALSMLADTWAEYLQARAYINENGSTYTVEGRNGAQIKTRPEVRIAADAWRRVRALLPEFGLTPSARTRVEEIQDAENDPLAEFLRCAERND